MGSKSSTCAPSKNLFVSYLITLAKIMSGKIKRCFSERSRTISAWKIPAGTSGSEPSGSGSPFQQLGDRTHSSDACHDSLMVMCVCVCVCVCV